jgi:hypothetical protein
MSKIKCRLCRKRPAIVDKRYCLVCVESGKANKNSQALPEVQKLPSYFKQHYYYEQTKESD